MEQRGSDGVNLIYLLYGLLSSFFFRILDEGLAQSTPSTSEEDQASGILNGQEG